MMDWLVRLLDLPECFMFGGKGGGIIEVNYWYSAWYSACVSYNIEYFKYQFKKRMLKTINRSGAVVDSTTLGYGQRGESDGAVGSTQ